MLKRIYIRHGSTLAGLFLVILYGLPAAGQTPNLIDSFFSTDNPLYFLHGDVKDEMNLLKVIATFYKSWWFLSVCLLLIVSGSVIITYTRNKKLTQHREIIEVEQAINSLASSLHEQNTIEDVLWDVARNCISRLNFEDCVIYLIDERNVLVQKAAWGPKMNISDLGEEENKAPQIVNPIEIPVGEGIVGWVAATGKHELVNDVTTDERYIIDDKARCSELAVPIVYNEKVIGVIDSEHSKKNFFREKHISILSTVASVCAQKIIRVRAEEERQRAVMELLDYKRKMAEAQLKSLRLQMNPHFLFNSLNSIQQIILSGDEKSATLYLSKFSKLLRHVLLHSDKEKISLKEELEMLTLYVELESLRFHESFHYEITCDHGVDVDEIEVPTLLIQPFVENAIWHGLLHKDGERRLRIRMAEDKTGNVICVVEDNGIGRNASRKINNQSSHSNKGITVATERLQAYNLQHNQKSNVIIEDLYDNDGLPAGTKVVMTLPLLN